MLRPLELDDIPRLVEIGREPEVARWWTSITADELTEKAEGRDECTPLAVLADGDLVGMIQWYEKDDPEYRRAGIDIFLSTEVHGRGLGTDAVRTLARWLIDDRGHHRVIIDPTAHNLPAVRAYEKAGFKSVGIMREYWRDGDGVWQDGLLMDLLARDL